MMKDRTCANCGTIFTPNSSRQKYCRQKLIRPCSVCGKPYTYVCESKILYTCNSNKCVAQYGFISFSKKAKPRKCRVCGKEFTPMNPRQLDCNMKITKQCTICGKPFNDICQLYHKQITCGSPDCLDKQRESSMMNTLSNTPKKCAWCGEEFIATHPSQIYCDRDHYNDCVICGKRFKLSKIVQLADIRKTCSKRCSNDLKFIEGKQNSPEAKAKQEVTNIERYGCKHPFQNDTVKAKWKATIQDRTGFDHPYHSPTVRSKAAKSARKSTLESDIAKLLDSYGIEYQTQYAVAKDNHCHAFDFYIPQYKILIDADGVYYHAYLSDADGKHSRDDYDDVRLSMIPPDHMFFVIVEKQEELCVKQIVDLIKSNDNLGVQYDSDLFDWCRRIGFPYPQYSDARLQKDFTKLQCANVAKYNPYSKISESAIHHFHKSIYDAHDKGCVSPKTAWDDDILLKSVITDRLIYKNDVDTSKVLAGFNISKICPRVSVFTPILGKYLTMKYLADYTEVFDPFSGFSGRLLGVTSTGKRYIGSDLNAVAVTESNQVIQHFGLNATITHNDIFDYSKAEYQALLTCPPYGDKEVYANETVFKSCDEWIDECLNRFECNRYVFVVDKTDNYTEYVTETLQSSSHFANIEELVIVVDKKTT